MFGQREGGVTAPEYALYGVQKQIVCFRITGGGPDERVRSGSTEFRCAVFPGILHAVFREKEIGWVFLMIPESEKKDTRG